MRAPLDDANLNYDGSRRSTALEPLAPVAYENRYGNSDQIKGMRFGGSYYLVAHLSAQMAERFGDGPFTMTLRVRVEGSGELGPAYDGRFIPQGVFAPVAGAGESSDAGTSGGADEKDDTAMTVVAVSGIGGGTVILTVLGVWTAAGRRRVSSS